MKYRGPLPLRHAGYDERLTPHSLQKWSWKLFTLPPANYRCRSCHHTWTQEPAIVSCPLCDHGYCDWLNYPDWAKVKTAVAQLGVQTELTHT